MPKSIQCQNVKPDTEPYGAMVMVRLHRIYGKCSESGGVITLEANRDAPDGIGCALCFMEWDGSLLRLDTERVDCWREEPWADLWFVARDVWEWLGGKGEPTYNVIDKVFHRLRQVQDLLEEVAAIPRKIRFQDVGKLPRALSLVAAARCVLGGEK